MHNKMMNIRIVRKKYILYCCFPPYAVQCLGCKVIACELGGTVWTNTIQKYGWGQN